MCSKLKYTLAHSATHNIQSAKKTQVTAPPTASNMITSLTVATFVLASTRPTTCTCKNCHIALYKRLHYQPRRYSQYIERKRVLVQNCRLAHLSVGLSVRNVYCGKTVHWIWMPFGMMSVVGQGMGVLDGVEIVEGKRQFWG